MRIGPRTRAAITTAVGLVLVIGPFVGPSSAQQEELIGYLGLGDSDAVTQTGGDPTQAGYPQAQSKTAHTYSSLDTGANGLALASSEWPGELVGNAGSLAQVFGAPEEAGVLNYPVRAEASTAGPPEASGPGMAARVDGPLAEAVATSGGFTGEGSEFLTFGEVRSVSRSELVDGVLVVTASATVTDIDIGGVITIDSVRTTSIARTDGTTGSNEGSTAVSGLAVAGQPARVDENGIHAGDGTTENPADAIAQTVIDDVLSNFAEAFEIEVYLSKPRSTDGGTIQEYRSGALVVNLVLGDPEAGQGGDGVLAIGGSNAYAQATSGLPFTATPLPPATATPFGTPVAPDPAPFDTGAVDFSPTDFAPTPSATIADVADVLAPAPVLDTQLIVDRFSGVGFVMPIIVLLGALVAGRGLRRFHEAVTEPTAAACLIDGEEP
ncbi:hypothetical protein [Actinospongicola halichondriae]|uniref:hypothetical protein n=1 Tax=Actinospongicola halichondriae TaxID=3236844 RepID=UPI003D41BFFA